MSAELIAELANMALAEVGASVRAFADPSPQFPFAVTGTGWPYDDFDKAVLLAKLKVQGPDALTACHVHSYQHLMDTCGGITVAEALAGRLCHRASS